MKLPEPYLYYADCETYTVDAVREIFADDSGMEKLYSETQLREAYEAGRKAENALWMLSTISQEIDEIAKEKK